MVRKKTLGYPVLLLRNLAWQRYVLKAANYANRCASWSHLAFGGQLSYLCPEVGIQSDKEGTRSPLFFCPLVSKSMSFDRTLVLEMLRDAIGEHELFIVGLTVSDSVLPKVTVILDGPTGLAIKECATISRRLAHRIDEHYGEESAYSLEVTSPGADQPLTDPRQYPRHIGRSLALKLADGTEKTGVLTAATAEGVEIEEVIKVKTKKTTLPAAFYPFADIAEAKVVISFK